MNAKKVWNCQFYSINFKKNLFPLLWITFINTLRQSSLFHIRARQYDVFAIADWSHGSKIESNLKLLRRGADFGLGKTAINLEPDFHIISLCSTFFTLIPSRFTNSQPCFRVSYLFNLSNWNNCSLPQKARHNSFLLLQLSGILAIDQAN